MKKRRGSSVVDRESKIASLRARRSSIFDPLSSSLGDLGRHIAALNLSGGGARDRLDDVNHFWTFELGERRAAMGDQRLINLSRRYLLATAIDQLFDTANQRQIAIAVQIPLITRAEPALGE